MLWLTNKHRSHAQPASEINASRRDWSPALHRCWITSVVGLWLLALVDWTICDRIPFLAVCFYATPPFVVSALAFLAVWIKPTWTTLTSRFERALTPAALLLCGVSLLQGFVVDFRPGSAVTPAPQSLRVVYWNIARGKFAGWSQLADRIREFDADIVAIAEATDDEVQSQDFWKPRFSGYSSLTLGDGLVVLVKGTVLEKPCDVQVKDGTIRHLSLKIGGTPLELILADLPSHPLVSRGPILGSLFQLMESLRDRPTLVVGDFNTPPTSVWFQPWRKDWRHAWEVAGHGYRPTWPLPVPVLALDHVWGNDLLTFHDCAGGWSRASDHRPLIVEFTLNTDRSPKTDSP